MAWLNEFITIYNQKINDMVKANRFVIRMVVVVVVVAAARRGSLIRMKSSRTSCVFTSINKTDWNTLAVHLAEYSRDGCLQYQ